MVVAVGLTFVEPLADVDVNDPGVMAMPVAPLVIQLSVLLEPELILAGFAPNEPIAGLPAVFTVMVAVDVAEPAAFVAVSVYVVVADGFMMVEPVAIVDVNDPGEMATLVAPEADQLSVLFDPEFTVPGFAVNELMLGTEPFPFPEDGLVKVAPVHPAIAAQKISAARGLNRSRIEKPNLSPRSLLWRIFLDKSIRCARGR